MALSQAIEWLSRPIPVSVQGPPGRPAKPGGHSVGCGSFRGASPALCWPEAGRGATSRGRRRASSASTRRPARARTRDRNRPRCPARSRPALRSRRAACRILARPAAGVVRGRDPSRQRRVSRDRHPARGPRRGRTRSPRFVVVRHGVPNRRNPLRFEPIYVEFREARTIAVSDLSARLHIKLTPHNRPTRQRCGRGQAPARSSAAPPCRSAASPP